MSDVPKYGEIVNVAFIDENRKLSERIAALEHMLELAAKLLYGLYSGLSQDDKVWEDVGNWLKEYKQ